MFFYVLVLRDKEQGIRLKPEKSMDWKIEWKRKWNEKWVKSLLNPSPLTLNTKSTLFSFFVYNSNKVDSIKIKFAL